MLRTWPARALAAVPILFALVVAQCPHGGAGFVVSLHVAGVRLAASTCRA